MHNITSGIPARDIHFIKLAKWIAFIVQCEWEKLRHEGWEFLHVSSVS